MELQALRATISSTGSTWMAADNVISALDPSELRVRLGATPPSGALSLLDRENARNALVTESSAPVPAHFDWRNIGGDSYVWCVRDQGACGSCVAFGSLAAVEGTARHQQNRPALDVDLSEAHLFYCHAADGGFGCDTGWWPSLALAALQNQGIVDEGCFPYTPGDQACVLCPDHAARLTSIQNSKRLTHPAEMKEWIANRGPTIVCFSVYDDFPHYQTGIYRHVTGSLRGGHCVCCVGYDEGAGCWICKNSWGSAWGEAGYFRIGYGECGIDFEMWGIGQVSLAPFPIL